MLRKFVLAGLGAAALVLGSAPAASAALLYVGSWRLLDGPVDFTPQSAQTVAASLFGGAASDYFVSNDFSNPESRTAWYFFETIPATLLEAADDATFYDDGDHLRPISPYWDDGFLTQNPFFVDQYVNYAFRQVSDCNPDMRVCNVGGVPEPATWALMILGFGSAGAMLRRRSTLAA